MTNTTYTKSHQFLNPCNPSSDMPFNPQLFENWPADQPTKSHQLIRDIRSAIIASGHDFQEGVKWGSPCYWLPEISRRTICWIQPHRDYVRLGFFNGATMPDPENLLEGSGKKLRHIKVYQLTNPTDPQTLTNYVHLSTQHAIKDPTSLSG